MGIYEYNNLNIDNASNEELKETINTLSERIQYLRTEVRKYKYDFLTGLKTRMDFDGYLKTLFEMYEFEDREFTLVLIDVDGLHFVNRTEGYGAGDKLINEIAQILILAFAECNGSEVFRIGGDESAILIKGFREENLQSLINSISNATCSYSVVNKDNHFASPADVFRKTDKELINKKNLNKGLNSSLDER